jgi:hypothetical protein
MVGHEGLGWNLDARTVPILGRKMCRSPEESVRLVQCLGAATVGNHLKEPVPPPVDAPRTNRNRLSCHNPK